MYSKLFALAQQRAVSAVSSQPASQIGVARNGWRFRALVSTAAAANWQFIASQGRAEPSQLDEDELGALSEPPPANYLFTIVSNYPLVGWLVGWYFYTQAYHHFFFLASQPKPIEQNSRSNCSLSKSGSSSLIQERELCFLQKKKASLLIENNISSSLETVFSSFPADDWLAGWLVGLRKMPTSDIFAHMLFSSVGLKFEVIEPRRAESA